MTFLLFPPTTPFIKLKKKKQLSVHNASEHVFHITSHYFSTYGNSFPFFVLSNRFGFLFFSFGKALYVTRICSKNNFSSHFPTLEESEREKHIKIYVLGMFFFRGDRVWGCVHVCDGYVGMAACRTQVSERSCMRLCVNFLTLHEAT